MSASAPKNLLEHTCIVHMTGLQVARSVVGEKIREELAIMASYFFEKPFQWSTIQQSHRPTIVERVEKRYVPRTSPISSRKGICILPSSSAFVFDILPIPPLQSVVMGRIEEKAISNILTPKGPIP